MHAVLFGSITSVSLFAMAGLSAMIDHSFIGFLGLGIAVLLFSGISFVNLTKSTASLLQSRPSRQCPPSGQSYNSSAEDIKA